MIACISYFPTIDIISQNVSKVTFCDLDDQGLFLSRSWSLSLHRHIQTFSEVHSVSYVMDTWDKTAKAWSW
jgi:hypothetical protein